MIWFIFMDRNIPDPDKGTTEVKASTAQIISVILWAYKFLIMCCYPHKIPLCALSSSHYQQ